MTVIVHLHLRLVREDESEHHDDRLDQHSMHIRLLHILLPSSALHRLVPAHPRREMAEAMGRNVVPSPALLPRHWDALSMGVGLTAMNPAFRTFRASLKALNIDWLFVYATAS